MMNDGSNLDALTIALRRARETLALVFAADAEFGLRLARGGSDDLQEYPDRRDALRLMYEAQMWEVRQLITK